MVVSFKEKLASPAVRMIILANLIPLFGVLLWGWSVGEIMLLYWSESAVIGFYNGLRMLLAGIEIPEIGDLFDEFLTFISGLVGKLFLVGFFTVHFGGFMLGHLIFILLLISIEGGSGLTNASPAGLIGILSTLWFAVLGFFISHGASFLENYIIKKEYEAAEAGALMILPYPRIVLMQVAIILGFFLLVITSSIGIPPIGPLIILIAGKTFSDLGGHLMEHSKFPTRKDSK